MRLIVLSQHNSGAEFLVNPDAITAVLPSDGREAAQIRFSDGNLLDIDDASYKQLKVMGLGQLVEQPTA